jgi:hypothetical protein
MYILLNLGIIKLFVFVNGSLSNFKDFISQIKYIIIFVNKFKKKNKFIVKGNLINISLTKYKYITRNSLVSKICRIINSFNLVYIIAATLKIIINQQNLPEIPIVLYIDSKFLYKCIIQLGITKEKHLIINIIAIRQAYKKKELFEIRYINKQDNPVDTIIKLLFNKILEKFVNTNELIIRMQNKVDC